MRWASLPVAEIALWLATSALLGTTAPSAMSRELLDLSAEGVRIEILKPAQGLGVPEAALRSWIRDAVRAVSHYYGKFPVAKLRIEVLLEGSRPIGLGQAFNAALIRIRLGPGVTEAALKKDWSMTHEMFHLGFPDLDEEHSWLQEGMATYLEPVARERVGSLTRAEVLDEWKSRMPEGLASPGDRGMLEAQGYRRIYWGGALFWHLSDVEIRRRTNGKKSLDDAMKAIRAAGGIQSETWPVDRVLETGDRATGTRVLHEMYAKMSSKPFATDLPSHWMRLEPGIINSILP